jgi:hypothetical protein
LRRRIRVTHFIDSRFEIKRNGVAHNGEVLVVNGERRLSARGQHAGQREDRKDFFHDEVVSRLNNLRPEKFQLSKRYSTIKRMSPWQD